MSHSLVSRAVRALLLCTTALATTLVDAADGARFHVRDNVRINGGAVTQFSNSTTFPEREGVDRPAEQLSLPGTSNDALRAVRLVIPIDAKRMARFLMVADKTNDGIFGETSDYALTMIYRGPSASGNINPFTPVHGSKPLALANSDASAWAQLIPFSRALSRGATHLLVTAYFLPRTHTPLTGPAPSNLIVTVDEASVQAGKNAAAGDNSTQYPGRIVARARLISDVKLKVDAEAWTHWIQQAIRAGSADTNRALVAGRVGSAAFVEQRMLSLASDGGHASGSNARKKRCVEDWILAATTFGSWFIERLLLGADSACSLDGASDANAPHRDLALVEIVPFIQARPNIDHAIYEATAYPDDEASAFARAAGILFCGDDIANGGTGSNDACTVQDHAALTAIGALSPRAVRRLLDQIAGIGASARGETQPLRTGNTRLDQWLNADWTRASNALDAALSVVAVSDAALAPEQPMAAGGGSAVLVKASCAHSDAFGEPHPAAVSEDDDSNRNAWQACTKKSQKKVGTQGKRFAVPPLVQSHGQYHMRPAEAFADLRRSDPFRRLIAQFNASGRSRPGGMTESQFPLMTRAIAVDGARTGDNLGIVFLNDATDRRQPGRRRFSFGLEHIWAPGTGGGDNAGHRGDWAALDGLPVDSLDMLAHIVMSALTDVNADYVQQRPDAKGNRPRTYRSFRFTYSGALYVIHDVRVILGQNGMVITAYPLVGAKAVQLNM